MRSAKAALAIISDGIDKAMNEYNIRDKKEKKPKKEATTEGEIQQEGKKEETASEG